MTYVGEGCGELTGPRGGWRGLVQNRVTKMWYITDRKLRHERVMSLVCKGD